MRGRRRLPAADYLIAAAAAERGFGVLHEHRHEGRARSEVVRDAIERYLAADREAEIDRLIVDAYTHHPAEHAGNEQAAKQMICAPPAPSGTAQSERACVCGTVTRQRAELARHPMRGAKHAERSATLTIAA